MHLRRDEGGRKKRKEGRRGGEGKEGGRDGGTYREVISKMPRPSPLSMAS